MSKRDANLYFGMLRVANDNPELADEIIYIAERYYMGKLNAIDAILEIGNEVQYYR